jgi:hypothetical protein
MSLHLTFFVFCWLYNLKKHCCSLVRVILGRSLKQKNSRATQR